MKEYCEQIEKTFDMFGKKIEDFNMDYRIIFDTAIKDIPVIKEFIDREIQKLTK